MTLIAIAGSAATSDNCRENTVHAELCANASTQPNCFATWGCSRELQLALTAAAALPVTVTYVAALNNNTARLRQTIVLTFTQSCRHYTCLRGVTLLSSTPRHKQRLNGCSLITILRLAQLSGAVQLIINNFPSLCCQLKRCACEVNGVIVQLAYVEMLT